MLAKAEPASFMIGGTKLLLLLVKPKKLGMDFQGG